MATQESIYDILKRDHQTVLRLLDEMADSSEADVSLRLQLFNRLKVELLSHAHAEEQLLYPELEEHRSLRDLALESEEEHHAVEALLRDIEHTDMRDEHWKAKTRVLREMLRHHVNVEESTLFEQAQKLFDTEQAQELAQRFQDQKRIEEHRI